MSPDEQVDWMRRRGVVSAEWDGEGRLLAATLGPEPYVKPSTSETSTQRTASPLRSSVSGVSAPAP